MNLLTDQIRLALIANAEATQAAQAEAKGDDASEPDPCPVLKLFNPVGAGTWIATEIGEDGDTLFGLADLGFGCPELGYFSLTELADVRLPFGLRIERDIDFASGHPLSVWAETARRTGSIILAESALRRAAAKPLPPAGG